MRLSVIALLLACGIAPGAGAQPAQVSYQGELSKDGTPFAGIADFKFAIVSGVRCLWSNDGTGTAHSAPLSSIALPVTGGLFSVRLGDPALSMVPVAADSLKAVSNAELRIWVKTGADFEQLSDQPLSSSPFSLVAQEARVADSVRAGGFPGDGAWEQSGLNVYRLVGNVGIGTAEPLSTLHIQGTDPRFRLQMDGAPDNCLEVRQLSGSTCQVNLTKASGSSSIDLNPQPLDGAGQSFIRVFRSVNTSGAKNFEFYHGDGTTTLSGQIGAGGSSSYFQLDGGNFGVGTSTPDTKLHVLGGSDVTLADGTGYVVVGSIQSTNIAVDNNEIQARNNGTASSLNLQAAGGDLRLVTGGGRVGVGTTSPEATLDVDGTTRTAILEITGGSDLAEPFDVSGAVDDRSIKSGMVVSIDPDHPGGLRVAELPYDTRVAGIISGANGLAPGLVMTDANSSTVGGEHPVALSGRVWCWVDAFHGPIHPGDLLTSSPTPGMAMIASDPRRRTGATIGKAMTSLQDGRGLVLVLVSLQ